MPTAKNEVKLKFGDKAKYASAIKNADTVYFITDTNQIFVGSSLVSSKCYYVTSEPSASNYGVGDIVVWKISENNAKICIVNSSGEFDILSISIPTELKNPNALKFTGAVTVTYDGSAAKTVNIPAAITVDEALSNISTNPIQNKAVANAIVGEKSDTGTSAEIFNDYAHNLATGNYSHAEGYWTEASGNYSHAQNDHTLASHANQTAMGKYNMNKSNTLLEVGNGLDDLFRSNAFEVYDDGHAEVKQWVLLTNL